VTLSSFVALLIFAATAAPGRVFERRVDERRPRHHRSSAAEYTEWLIIGAASTLMALLAVGLVADLTHILDAGALLEGPGKYAEDHTAAVIGCSFATIIVSFAFAEGAARLITRSGSIGYDDAYSQETIWRKSFDIERPPDKAVTVSLEFAEGLRISGDLRGYTPTDAEDRELLLTDCKARRPGRRDDETVDGLIIVRESQVKLLTAAYAPVASTSS
jgi:Family of unknown function (DUF6338)